MVEKSQHCQLGMVRDLSPSAAWLLEGMLEEWGKWLYPIVLPHLASFLHALSLPYPRFTSYCHCNGHQRLTASWALTFCQANCKTADSWGWCDEHVVTSAFKDGGEDLYGQSTSWHHRNLSVWWCGSMCEMSTQPLLFAPPSADW